MLKLRGNSNGFFRFGGNRTVSLVEQDAETDRDRRWSAWIERMAKGDIEALSALYDESSPVIFSLVLEILHERKAAEDTLVEIYNHARNKAAGFDARRQAPLDWLITLARNFAVDRLRRASPLPVPATNKTPDLFKHKRHLANLALATLTEEERAILELTYLGGLTAAEVGNLLDVSPESVTEQIVLAMKKLRAGSRNLDGVTIRFSNLASF